VNILPIKYICDFDREFGAAALSLAKLERGGIPIAPGFVVCPPDILLQTFLEHFQTAGREIFEQRLTVVKGKINSLPTPYEFEKVFGKGGPYLFKGEVFKNKKDLFRALLNFWVTQIYGAIWQNGFSPDLISRVLPQLVFTIEKKIITGSAYFDPNLLDVTIKASLDEKQKEEIKEIVLSANKKLFLPFIYEFIVTGGKVFLVGLTPFTQTLAVSESEDVILPQAAQGRVVKSAVKVFFNLSSGFAIPGTEVDGVIIEAENILDSRQTDKRVNFENLVFKTEEAALSFQGCPVVFCVPNIKQKSIFDLASDAFLFVRNKKALYNVELGIPEVRFAEELVRIKQELSSRGITRKGTLRFWQEMGIPENLINIEDYLGVGIDGVIVDLDKLQNNLLGFKKEETEYYGKEVSALVKFLVPGFKVLHKAKIPVLAKGIICMHSDILDVLLENGVYGIIANTKIEAESLPDHLHFSERRMVVKRLS